MKKQLSTFIFLMTICFGSFSQHRFALNIGYDKVGIHSGYLGTEYRLNSNNRNNSNGPLNMGVGTYLHQQGGNLKITPELHLNQTWKHYLLSELSVSPKNVRPSVGLSFFNLGRMQFGYSIPIDHSSFKGFYFGFHILIGKAPFYDEIKVF